MTDPTSPRRAEPGVSDPGGLDPADPRTTADPRTAADRRRAPVQRGAAGVGAVFLLVGVLGFIPGVTTHYDSLMVASHESEALLLGLFQVSVLHNVVHLLFGVLGLAMARTVRTARTFLVAGGVVYLVLFVYGLLVPHDSSANFVPLNTADNWLHVILGVGMIALGLLLSRRVVDDVRPGV